MTGSTNGNNQTVGHEYDLRGMMTQLTHPVGRIKTITDWLGHTTVYALDLNGNPSTETYANGVVATSTPGPPDGRGRRQHQTPRLRRR